ncbi:MAG: GerW family sporulation protein [Syntrophothermus sp.]
MEHPIEGLMKTAMESIKNMVDVNTILGDPVETPDGNVIVPISRVTFGFAAGGTEFESEMAGEKDKDGRGDGSTGGGGNGGQKRSAEGQENALPFGGGSGAGISIQPVAFLVVGHQQVRLLPVDGRAIYDRLLDMAPGIIDQLQSMMSKTTGRTHGQAGQVKVGASYQGGGQEQPGQFQAYGAGNAGGAGKAGGWRFKRQQGGQTPPPEPVQ